MRLNIDGDDVEIPDNTSPENRQRIVRMHLIRAGKMKADVGPDSLRQSAQEEVEARDPNPWDRFWTGTGVRAREMAAGLQTPFKNLSPEQQGVLDMSRSVRTAEGPVANLGSAAADIGVAALPLAKAAMLGTKAPAAAALLRAAPKALPRIAATGAVGAGLGAALTPDNRGTAAALGATAAAGPALGAANKALKTKGVIPATLPEALHTLKKYGQSATSTGTLGILGHMLGLPVLPIAKYSMAPAAGLYGASELASALPQAFPGLIYGGAEEVQRATK